MSAAMRSQTLAVDKVQAAGAWLTRLHEEDVSEATIAEWIEWCESDADNLAAFEEMQTLWKSFGELPEAVPRRIMAKRSAAPLDTGPPTNIRAFLARWLGATTWRPALGALALLAVVSVLWLPQTEVAPPRLMTAALQTATAIDEESTLPDGSTVAVGAKSSLTIDFGKAERRLRMSDGQAFFKVKPDKSRPFVVDAGAIRIKAVGTAFDVRKNEDRIVVSVTEGKVEILPGEAKARIAGANSETRLLVSAGFQVTWREEGKELKLARSNPQSSTAWREGRLEYFGEPLRTVVENVNRYATHQIVIADDDLGQMQFTGTVFVRSIDEWVSALQQAFPIVLVPQADGSLLLKRRAKQPERNVVSAF